PRGAARGLPHRLGDPDALADRHGRRSGSVRRSEPVAKSLRGKTEHRTALEHVLLRVEEGAQDHLLPALAPGDPHRQGDGGRRRRGRLLPREPRAVRGLRMSRQISDATSLVARPARLLDPGLCLTLRPMAYPIFFEMYRAAIKNTWTVEEVDFSTDVADLRTRMTDAERHLVQRLVAFFATGDSIVANNLVLNLYEHINAPEARMYLSRQLF